MYVLAHEDLPDRTFDNYTNAFTELNKLVSCVVYHYVNYDGHWLPVRRYCMRDDEIVNNTPGHWEVPSRYQSYRFPNICETCNRDNWMQGSYCTFCYDSCLDCGQVGLSCTCVFTDY